MQMECVSAPIEEPALVLAPVPTADTPAPAPIPGHFCGIVALLHPSFSHNRFHAHTVVLDRGRQHTQWPCTDEQGDPMKHCCEQLRQAVSSGEITKPRKSGDLVVPTKEIYHGKTDGRPHAKGCTEAWWRYDSTTQTPAFPSPLGPSRSVDVREQHRCQNR